MLLRRYLSNVPGNTLGTVEEVYTITGYTRRSNTSMTFYTNRGNDRLELEDGSAFLTAEGIEYPVCAADVTCSAFKMDETAFLGSQIDDIYYTLFPEENATTASRRKLSLGRKVGRILWGSGSKRAFKPSKPSQPLNTKTYHQAAQVAQTVESTNSGYANLIDRDDKIDDEEDDGDCPAVPPPMREIQVYVVRRARETAASSTCSFLNHIKAEIVKAYANKDATNDDAASSATGERRLASARQALQVLPNLASKSRRKS